MSAAEPLVPPPTPSWTLPCRRGLSSEGDFRARSLASTALTCQMLDQNILPARFALRAAEKHGSRPHVKQGESAFTAGNPCAPAVAGDAQTSLFSTLLGHWLRLSTGDRWSREPGCR